MRQSPPLVKFVHQLSEISLFAGLGEPTLQELALLSRWREYDTGEIVVLEGEAHPSLYFLDYGWLKVIKTSPSGREQILLFLEPGDTFNEIGVFASQINPATAIALEPAGALMSVAGDAIGGAANAVGGVASGAIDAGRDFVSRINPFD